MVDFQSRDTRRGPTDGDDDEAGADEAEDDPESTDPESTTDTSTESTDSTAPDDEDTTTATAEEGTGATTATPDADADETDATTMSETSETESSPAEVIDEAVSRTTDSQSATEQRGAEGHTSEATAEDGVRPPSQPSETEPSAGGTTDAAATDQSPRADEPDDPLAAPSSDRTAPDADARAQQVDIAVVTVGTATEDGDPTGDAVETALEDTGQAVVATERLRGDYDGIQQAVDRLVGREDVEVVVTAGGIGVGPSAHTLEAVHPLFEKALPGFEEVYRSLLFERQGTGVIRVRATAGIADETPVFCLPADPTAARVAIDEIISAEAGPLVDELA